MSDTEKSAQAQPNESVEPSFRYNAKLAQGIEEKWQKIWDDEGTFWAANVNGDLKDGKGHNAEGRPSYFAIHVSFNVIAALHIVLLDALNNAIKV